MASGGPCRASRTGEEPRTVPLLAVMIGSVSFDGVGEAPLWTNMYMSGDIAGFSRTSTSRPRPRSSSRSCWAWSSRSSSCGASTGWACGRADGRRAAVGQAARERVRAVAGADRLRIRRRPLRHAAALPGQSLIEPSTSPFGYALSNPLGGEGTDVFGTADEPIDYSVIGATAAWYHQVAFVVVGHVAGLTVANDKALAMYEDAKQAVRSQYWLLIVMVGFTSLARWLLAQSNG